MEIERKFVPPVLPENLEEYDSSLLEQGYLSVSPVVRVRREDDRYYMTYKGSGMMIREEYNLPLTQEAYEHLVAKADGIVIRKRRYRIPLDNGLTAELDCFEKDLASLVILEVEFPDRESADAFRAPDWFGPDVTSDCRYHNSWLSLHGLP